MAIRLRNVCGTWVALCAVESDPQKGDIYLDDAMHHALDTKFAIDFNNMFGYKIPVEDDIKEKMETQKVRDAQEELLKWLAENTHQ